MDDLSNPLQAGLVDMFSFTVGAAIPLLIGSFVPNDTARIVSVAGSTVIACALAGLTSSLLSGVKVAVGTLRVVIVGVITLGATYAVGYGFSKLE